MLIEFYRRGDEIPALYDIFIDLSGNVVTMQPAVDCKGLLQVVLDSDDGRTTDEQFMAMYALITFYDECEFELYGITPTRKPSDARRERS